MIYSEKLKTEVNEVYHSERMNHLAETGDFFLGRYLCDSQGNGIPASIILSATSLEALKEIALKEQRKSALYVLWGQEVDKLKGII